MIPVTWLAATVLAATAPASDAAGAGVPADFSRRGVGFTAGGTSGVGFAWREVFRDGYGYSVGGGVWIDSFEQPSARWAVGLQGIRVLHQTPWWRLYLLAGVQSYGYPTYQPAAPVAPDAPAPAPSPPVLEHLVNAGGGLGLELGGPPGVSLAFELPVLIGYRIGPNPGLHHLLPFPNLMLLYNF